MSTQVALALILIGGLLIVAREVSRGIAVRPGATEPRDSSALGLSASFSNLLSTAGGELSQVDVGLMNLLCAANLPGNNDAGMHTALVELDRMAGRVKAETEWHYRKFQTEPQEFNGSEANFKMLCLVTVLQQDFGIRYSPDRAKPSDGPIEPNEAFFADSRDIFLHGLLGPKRTGTCASLPVLYVAVGRRLGYPLKLVAAKNHLFVRWESDRERINIEASTQGLTTFDDDYYRGWPFPMTPDEERTERYLISLSPAEELSVFLSLRTQCLLAAGWWNEAVLSQEQVCRLAPHSVIQREILDRMRNDTNHSRRRNQNHQTAISL